MVFFLLSSDNIQSVSIYILFAGCFFHFRQSIRRKLGELNLLKLYNSNSNFQAIIQRFVALAFVPPEKVIEYFEIIEEERSLEGDEFADFPLEDFIKYFELTYIGARFGRKGLRKPPRFDIEIWNLNRRALDKQDTTSNSVESWNNAWTYSCAPNSNLWKVLEAVRKEEALNQVRFNQPIKFPMHSFLIFLLLGSFQSTCRYLFC